MTNLREKIVKEFKDKYKDLDHKQNSRINEFYNLYSLGKIPTKRGLDKAINTYLSPKYKNENKREVAYLKTLVKFYKTTPIKEKNKQKKSEQAYKKLQEQYKQFEQKYEEKIDKPKKASSKIGRFVRQSTVFNIVKKEKAFKSNVVSVTLKPKFIGSKMFGNIASILARAYFIARKEIPKNASFKLKASAQFEFSSDLIDQPKRNITTKIYNIRKNEKGLYPELGKFFEDLTNRFALEYGDAMLIVLLHITYEFVIIPDGSGCSTVNRDRESILNKRSVLRINNNDNNCFWYALACLMNPNNRAIRDHRNILAREKAGQ
jgi:hypothetical protein